jgi:hypothetical protein
MGNEVYANMMEVSCKAAMGKSICAFPDVCFTPPLTPATPPGVPIPYPNTGMASDTTSGSTSVKISGQEVMLKNKSYFKRSMGDEAGCAPKKAVVTSVNMGKVYFTMWSVDVKVEGENVVRMMDMTTHNHASLPGSSPPWPYTDQTAISLDSPCVDDMKAEHSACSGKTAEQACDDQSCQAARKCMLLPYRSSGESNCCPGQTGHHMIEDHWVQGNSAFPSAQGSGGRNAAPCVCCEGTRYDKQHGIMHSIQGVHEDSFLPGGANAGKDWSYDRGKKASLRAHQIAFSGSDCNPKCIEAQLDSFYGAGPKNLNQPTQKQPLLRDAAEEGMSRGEAEAFVDMWFGGAGL